MTAPATAPLTALTFTRDELWSAYDVARLAGNHMLMQRFRAALEGTDGDAVVPQAEAEFAPTVAFAIEQMSGNSDRFRRRNEQLARLYMAEGRAPEFIATAIRRGGTPTDDEDDT